MKKIIALFLSLALFSIAVPIHAALFDPSDPGVNIGTQLPAGYEPSGIIWHSRLASLILVWDNGYVTQMDTNGAVIRTSQQRIANVDLEGITIVDEQSNFIYLLQEFPQQILEFDLTTWNTTGRVWSLAGMQGNARSGAEALTYHRANREFYVGSQFDGQIYVYRINLASPGEVQPVRTIATGIDRNLSALSYWPETSRTYALFSSGKIQEYDARDTRVVQYDVPGSAQEGLTLLPGCPGAAAPMIIAQDNGPVMRYARYPIQCPAPAAPPRWERVYDSAALTPYATTEVRENYHVFDNKWEFSYFRLPAQEVDSWYSIELDARATSADAFYNLGVNVRNAQGRFTETRIVDRIDWAPYRFYHYIPAGMPTEIRIISGVRGSTAGGAKREHHLRKVTLRRVSDGLDPLTLPAITNVVVNAQRTAATVRVDTSLEAQGTVTINGVLMTNTDLTTSKTWTVSGLQCGRVYNYEMRLMGDLYNPVFNNAVVIPGAISPAPCP